MSLESKLIYIVFLLLLASMAFGAVPPASKSCSLRQPLPAIRLLKLKADLAKLRRANQDPNMQQHQSSYVHTLKLEHLK